jgi:hypothetical protein
VRAFCHHKIFEQKRFFSRTRLERPEGAVTVCGSSALTINVLIQKNEDWRGRFGTPKRLSDRGVWSKACPAFTEDSTRKK